MSTNKDQVKGQVNEANGQNKEGVGHVVGNKELEHKGNIQKDEGEAPADDLDEDGLTPVKGSK